MSKVFQMLCLSLGILISCKFYGKSFSIFHSNHINKHEFIKIVLDAIVCWQIFTFGWIKTRCEYCIIVMIIDFNGQIKCERYYFRQFLKCGWPLTNRVESIEWCNGDLHIDRKLNHTQFELFDLFQCLIMESNAEFKTVGHMNFGENECSLYFDVDMCMCACVQTALTTFCRLLDSGWQLICPIHGFTWKNLFVVVFHEYWTFCKRDKVVWLLCHFIKWHTIEIIRHLLQLSFIFDIDLERIEIEWIASISFRLTICIVTVEYFEHWNVNIGVNVCERYTQQMRWTPDLFDSIQSDFSLVHKNVCIQYQHQHFFLSLYLHTLYACITRHVHTFNQNWTKLSEELCGFNQ